MRTLVFALAVLGSVAPVQLHGEDLCEVLARPKNFAQKLITIRASAKPTMHGTYLRQPGCDESILVALPEEIPHYGGLVRLVKDADFDAFLKARSNHLPDAPGFDATFIGQLEYSPKAKFGYYKNHHARLVLKSVQTTATAK